MATNSNIHLEGSSLRVFNRAVHRLAEAAARELPLSVPRRERSLDEHSCQVREYRPWYYYKLYCAHDRLWVHKCSMCERCGITVKERATRMSDATAWLYQQSREV